MAMQIANMIRHLLKNYLKVRSGTILNMKEYAIHFLHSGVFICFVSAANSCCLGSAK